MPTYIYKCKKDGCGRVVTREQSIKDEPLVDEPCPDEDCEGTLERAIAGAPEFLISGYKATNGYS